MVRLILLLALASNAPAQEAPKLAVDRVLSLAQTALEKCTTKGSSYKPGAPEYVAEGKEWWVVYREEGNIHPHSGMIIVVNDLTERTCVHAASEPAVIGRCE